jgi:hypothetical protein
MEYSLEEGIFEPVAMTLSAFVLGIMFAQVGRLVNDMGGGLIARAEEALGKN